MNPAPQVRPEIGRPTWSRDLLVPHDRPTRLAIPIWIHRISRLLSEAARQHEADPPMFYQLLSRVFNETALVEVYYGRLPHADQLCRSASAWFTAEAIRTGDPRLYRFVLQAFVNRARLDRIEHRWDAALSKIGHVFQTTRHKVLVIEHAEISPSTVADIIRADASFLRELQNIYVIDSLKTLLKAARYENILQFVNEEQHLQAGSLQDFMLEASILALAELEHIKRAHAMIEDRLRFPNRVNRPVFLLRRVEVLLAVGEHLPAGLSARVLRDAYLKASTALGLNRLALLERVARAFINIDAEDAYRLSEVGYAGSVELGDVPLQRAFLVLIEQMASTEERRSWARGQSKELYNAAWYGAASNNELAGAALLDDVYERLQQVTADTNAAAECNF